MPSGNLIFAPGFIQDGTAPNAGDASTSNLLSVPGEHMLGSPDELVDSTIVNPFADSSSLLSSVGPLQPSEGLFMQPFLRNEISENDTVQAGKEVGKLVIVHNATSPVMLFCVVARWDIKRPWFRVSEKDAIWRVVEARHEVELMVMMAR